MQTHRQYPTAMKIIVIALLSLVACGKPEKGEPGSAGPAGATGAMGVAGVMGVAGMSGVRGATGATGLGAPTGTQFSASLLCDGQLGVTGVWFSYVAAVMKSGDVFASGSIRSSSIEISNTKFYANTQVGALTAEVIMLDDLQGTANAGYWIISVDRSTAITTIVYHDSDATGGMTTWTMTPDKCILNNY